MPGSSAQWLRIVLLVSIAAFEAGVGLLALRPNVPDRFRAYFIERSTDCWPLEASGAFAMGETISFLPGSNEARALTACGWAEPTHEGTWATGPEARLRFKLEDPPSGDLELELQILGFVTEQHLQQRVVVEANEVEVAHLTLQNGTSSRQVIPIPNDLVSGSGRLEVTFHLPDAVSPKSQGLGNDRRRLAMRLLSVRPSPVPQVAQLGGALRPGL